VTRQVLYVAHPVAPNEDDVNAVQSFETLPGRGEYEPDHRQWIPEAARSERALHLNLQRAMRWLAWLRKSFPETTFIAPWIASIMAGEDGTPESIEAALIDCCAVVERCDGIVLCGGRISSGMRREMEHGETNGRRGSYDDRFQIYDLTALGPEVTGMYSDHLAFPALQALGKFEKR
jgi:hypothetical protein